MRKYMIGFLAAFLSLAVAGSVIAATVDQSIEGKVSPKKLKYKMWKKAKLDVTTAGADADDPGAIPAPTNRAKVDFPKDVRLNQGKVVRCNQSLENTDRTAALEACGDSKISKDGGSSAMVALAGPGGARLDFPAAVMAFNGPKQGKRGTIILWTRIEAVSATSILTGVLKKAKGKKYGTQLDVTVPPIAGGTGALTEFSARIKEGKFVEARCKQGKMRFRGQFFYTGAASETVTDSHKCKAVDKSDFV